MGAIFILVESMAGFREDATPSAESAGIWTAEKSAPRAAPREGSAEGKVEGRKAIDGGCGAALGAEAQEARKANREAERIAAILKGRAGREAAFRMMAPMLNI